MNSSSWPQTEGRILLSREFARLLMRKSIIRGALVRNASIRMPDRRRLRVALCAGPWFRPFYALHSMQTICSEHVDKHAVIDRLETADADLLAEFEICRLARTSTAKARPPRPYAGPWFPDWAALGKVHGQPDLSAVIEAPTSSTNSERSPDAIIPPRRPASGGFMPARKTAWS